MKGGLTLRPLRLAIAIVLVCAVLVPGLALANCGAEGCPFVRHGLDTEYGRFSFDLRFQAVAQDKLWDGSSEITLDEAIKGAEQHGEVELYTHTRSWVGEVRGTINDRLSVVATLPFIERQHQHMLAHVPAYNPQFVSSWDYQGLGDLAVVGRYDAWRGSGDVASLVGGIKMPTGRTHVPDESQDNLGIETTLEPSARPGTGSWDWIVGVSAAKSLPWRKALPISASVLGKINTRGTDDFKVGSELQAGIAGGYAPIPRVSAQQVNFGGHAVTSAPTPPKPPTPGSARRSHPGRERQRGRVASRLRASLGAWGRERYATIVANDHILIGTSFAIVR